MTTNQTEKPNERAELFRLVAHGMPETIEKFQLAIDAAFVAGKTAALLEAEAQRPALRPLLESEIVDQMPADLFPQHMTALYRFARAIEAKHGIIKEQA